MPGLDMPDQADVALRIVLAVLLGSLIGLERELTGQAAGLRTHLSVALGAALFGIVSAYGFGEFIGARESTNYQVDPTRVASTIVTGVGFLGGGAIVKHGTSVKGLTTAASLWVTAAVGLAVGVGSIFEATFTTLLLIAALAMLRGPRRWLRQRFAVSKESVVIEVDGGARVGAVVDALHGLEGIEVRALAVRHRDGRVMVEADLRGTDVAARLADLAAQEGVNDLDFRA